MERSLDFVILLDIYGELLANSQREALDMRYNADPLLAEIAEEMGGVTRQSVVSAIKRASSAWKNWSRSLASRQGSELFRWSWTRRQNLFH